MKIPSKLPRRFLSPGFKIENWENVKPWLEDLKNRPINSETDLQQWLADRSELESILEEDMAWRYIRMTCDTANEALQQSFQFFVSEIEPHIQPYTNDLNEKLLQSPFKSSLVNEADEIMLKKVEWHHRIFREENIPLQTRLQQEQVKYGAAIGSLMVTVDGEEMTLQKAGNFLFSPDRAFREQVYRQLQEKRTEKKEELDALFDTLVQLRTQVARNAGFENFRDYMFVELCRFDYSKDDCFRFHEAVKEEIVPLINKLAAERKQALGIAELRPWDLSVDKKSRPALKPFTDGKDLTQKSIACFSRLDPFLGECLELMREMKHLDLESRKGKAPGGYNYPLYESGVPFIFMNAASSLRDLVTMVHEGGHAVHSILTKDLANVAYKNLPSEVAELASMSMELLSMKYWDEFFENEEDLKRAKRDHLEQLLDTLPWVATIDKFQHWIYENPGHNRAERTAAWNKIHSEFSASCIHWDGLESFKSNIWQKQLHLFEVPFYYIEYGIAQLGAIAVWKHFSENPEAGLKDYLEALKLGYTRPIAEIYRTAGIRFDFSQSYIGELAAFVNKELEKLG